MLGDFTYCNPTKLYFGEKALDNLEPELRKYGNNVAFVYGGGSIKKSGLYDQVMTILNKTGKKVAEISEVMANPTIDKLREGIAIARENNVDFICLQTVVQSAEGASERFVVGAFAKRFAYGYCVNFLTHLIKACNWLLRLLGGFCFYIVKYRPGPAAVGAVLFYAYFCGNSYPVVVSEGFDL